MPRFLRKFFSHWFDSNEFPWLWPCPWRLTASEQNIRHLRLHATRILRQQKIAEQGWIRTLSQAAAWPAISLIKICQDIPPRLPLKRSLNLFCNKWVMLMWHHIRLSDQLDLCLEQPANRRRIRSFMPCRELQAINTLSRRHEPGWPHIETKLSFARFCQQHDLPTPAILAASDPTIVTEPEWPRRDLFLKPADQGKGIGMETLRYQPSCDAWQNRAGDRVTSQNLAAYAAKAYAGGPWLLQPRLRNGAAWTQFTTHALSTARVMTGRNPTDGEPVFISGFIRFPFQKAEVDNLSAGGIGAGVMGPAGIMMQGFTWVGQTGTYSTHPETGVRFEGESLPHWPELVKLALKAHRAAAGWMTIGWDVTLSEEGPMLIEANLNWAVPFHEPLTETPFISILQSAFGSCFEGLRELEEFMNPAT